MANKNDEPLTWAQLKKIANKIPKKLLKNKVQIWKGEDFSGLVISDVEILKEDYLHSGDDETCSPRSQMKDALAENKKLPEDQKWDYSVCHPKGTRILFVD